MLEDTPTPVIITATTIVLPTQPLQTDTPLVLTPTSATQISEPPPTSTFTPVPPTFTPTNTPDIVIRTLISNVAGNYYPDLAQSWQISDDGTLWVFNLRSDVTMADGSHFTSAIMPSALADWSAVRLGIVAVVAVDDYTVQMEFPQPPTDFKKLFNDLSEIEFKTLR